MSWQAKKTASSAQARVTQSVDCYLSLMRRYQVPYLPHAMRTDHHVVGIVRQTDHPTVEIQRQIRPNNSTPHRLAKIGTEQFGTIHTAFGRIWIVEQDTPAQFMDHQDASQLRMTATYSDVTNLVTPGPITTDGLHQRCAVTQPDIEAPHTLSASQMKYWTMNSRGVQAHQHRIIRRHNRSHSVDR